ncbi:MAG: OB-fold domain-containing protein [Nocardioides sp.]|jgi:uncharacterized OB-fold protein
MSAPEGVEPSEVVEQRRDHDWIMAQAAEMQARGETAPRPALDAVNPAMIRHWAEAMGDTDPRWQGADGVAPPAMAQVWTMYGLDPHRPSDDPLHGTMQALDAAGFTSVLGTNCDQTYARPLAIGERPEISTRLTSVVGPKRTGVGEGYFVTTESIWRVDGEEVATMTFRVLKFKPGTGRPSVDRTKTVRPVINRDNAFFFEGTALGEVRIQKCNACGELRHPPGPVCPSCHAMDRGWIVASGRGVVHSYVVHHAPQLPGKRLPLPLAVVELEEGVRLVGAVQGVTEDAPLEIGAAVRAVFDRIDDDLTLVAFRPESAEIPAESAGIPAESAEIPAESAEIAQWSLPITPTLIVSTALATRDFQDVHHDRDLAIKRGSKDIFLNILTTTGLAQKYVGDWAREQRWDEFKITACALRLGAPAYPYDTLTFTGAIVEEEGNTLVVDVTGKVSLGDHVTARITLEKS